MYTFCRQSAAPFCLLAKAPFAFARALRVACVLCALPLLFSAAHAQTATRLSQVKKVYVDSLGTDHGAVEIREELIRRLRKSAGIEVVDDAKGADAVLKGSGRIWVTGHVSLNPRTHSPTQPTFGGVLSAEVIGGNGETLWSYLVSPGSFLWNGITDDLAHQIVNKFLAAIPSDRKQGSAATTAAEGSVGKLKGAGGTFPAPIYQRWFEDYEEIDPKAQIGYDAVGSGEGIKRLEAGSVDFAGSEMPLSDQAMSEADHRYVHVPTVLGGVVVIYNLNGLRQTLNFTPGTLAGIYLGKIRKWNDPEIRKSNRDAQLPDAEIVVLHRSDASGTSLVWSDYLSKVSPQWKSSVGSGDTVQWPVGTAAGGNEGVAAAVQQTPNSIGYVEFIYAIQHELRFGTVENASGQFITASIASVTAAAERTGPPVKDFRISITNAAGKDAYPISTYTWLLFPERIANTNKKAALTDIIRWALTEGQKRCAALGYAPLPPEIAKDALDSLTK